MKNKGDSISCLFFAELLWRRFSVPVQKAELCYRGVHGVRDHLKCPCCYKASDGSVQHGSKISQTLASDEIILSFPLRLAESTGESHVHELGVKSSVEKNLSGASHVAEVPSTIQFAHPIPGGFILLVVGIILG